MSGCNIKIPDYKPDCSPGPGRVKSITIEQPSPKTLRATKVIYNYKAKTEKQIQDAVQLEIDSFLRKYIAYHFVNSKSHFNGTGGIELQLNFELKSSL
jgi:hypothetical protein